MTPDMPVPLTELAEAIGCKPERLHELRRRETDPLPCHVLPGGERGWFVRMSEFWDWMGSEEGR